MFSSLNSMNFRVVLRLLIACFSVYGVNMDLNVGCTVLS